MNNLDYQINNKKVIIVVNELNSQHDSISVIYLETLMDMIVSLCQIQMFGWMFTWLSALSICHYLRLSTDICISPLSRTVINPMVHMFNIFSFCPKLRWIKGTKSANWQCHFTKWIFHFFWKLSPKWLHFPYTGHFSYNHARLITLIGNGFLGKLYLRALCDNKGIVGI